MKMMIVMSYHHQCLVATIMKILTSRGRTKRNYHQFLQHLVEVNIQDVIGQRKRSTRLILETSSTLKELPTSTSRTEHQPKVNKHVLGVIFQQYSLKAGLKQFGKEYRAAVNKELRQHHAMVMVTSMDGTNLPRQAKVDALGALMFLTKRRDGKVKART